MKRLLVLPLLLLSVPASAEFSLSYWQSFSSKAIQEFNNSLTQASRFGTPRYTTAAAPVCNASNTGAIIYNTTAGQHQSCNGSAYVAMSGGGGGSGDFVGPASSTDNAIVRFDGTTGKLGQNSAVTISDFTGGATFSIAGSATLVELDASVPFFFSQAGSRRFGWGSGQFLVRSDGQVGFSSNVDPSAAALDTTVVRSAAGVWGFGTGSAVHYILHGRPVEVSIVSKTPTAVESGETYTNTGDADGSTFTLPNDPTIGVFYTVVAVAAQNITITASAGETLMFGNSTCGTSLVVGGAATGIGDTVTIMAATGGSGALWVTTASAGTPVCTP